jgi:hypothetical protein
MRLCGSGGSERMSAHDESVQSIRVEQHVIGYDQRAKAVTIKEERKVHEVSRRVSKKLVDVLPVFAPAVDVAAESGRLAVAAMIEGGYGKTVRGESRNETGVAPRVFSKAMNDRDNAPQCSNRLPCLEIQIQSAGSTKSGLPVLDHVPNLVLPGGRAISLISA